MNDTLNFRKTPVTFCLILINCLVYFILSAQGSTYDSFFMLSKGADYYPLSLSGEPWRMFTSMFLHFGITHLLYNMIGLLAVGTIIEQSFGKLKYLLLYLLCGFCSGFCSCLYHKLIEQPVVSAGASGAVFGLLGALCFLAIRKETGKYGIDPKRVPLSIAVTLLTGTIGNTDLSAHASGLIFGFLFAFLLYRKQPDYTVFSS